MQSADTSSEYSAEETTWNLEPVPDYRSRKSRPILGNYHSCVPIWWFLESKNFIKRPGDVQCPHLQGLACRWNSSERTRTDGVEKLRTLRQTPLSPSSVVYAQHNLRFNISQLYFRPSDTPELYCYLQGYYRPSSKLEAMDTHKKQDTEL